MDTHYQGDGGIQQEGEVLTPGVTSERLERDLGLLGRALMLKTGVERSRWKCNGQERGQGVVVEEK